MDSANAALPDLDGLSIAELKALVYEQHAQLHTHKLQIERLNLLIARLRRVQSAARARNSRSGSTSWNYGLKNSRPMRKSARH